MTTQELNASLQASIDLEDKKGIALVDRRSASLAEMRPAMDPLLSVMDKLANNPNLDADKLERLLNVFIDGQRKMAEMADERTYYDQMAEFKKNPPGVIKKLKAKIAGTSKGGRDYAYEVPYADLNAYADAAMADLALRGITWDFEVVDTAKELTVTCLMHYGLYTRRGSTISGDPALLQSPNSFMQKGSAQSYLMRYSFCASTGLTAALPGDKNATTLTPRADAAEMEEGAVKDYLASIEGSGDIDELQRRYQEALTAAEKAGDKAASKAFAEKKNDTYRKLARRQ